MCNRASNTTKVPVEIGQGVGECTFEVSEGLLRQCSVSIGRQIDSGNPVYFSVNKSTMVQFLTWLQSNDRGSIAIRSSAKEELRKFAQEWKIQELTCDILGYEFPYQMFPEVNVSPDTKGV